MSTSTQEDTFFGTDTLDFGKYYPNMLVFPMPRGSNREDILQAQVVKYLKQISNLSSELVDLRRNYVNELAALFECQDKNRDLERIVSSVRVILLNAQNHVNDADARLFRSTVFYSDLIKAVRLEESK